MKATKRTGRKRKTRIVGKRALVDLAWAGTEADGTLVYDSPKRALSFQLGLGIGRLVGEYPRQAGQCFALVALAAACVVLTWRAIRG